MDKEAGNSWTLEELRGEFERYSSLINAADLAPSSKTTNLVHADRFIRWLAGEVEMAPGRRPSA